MTPYWEGDGLALYLGDCREVLPALGLAADCVIADPPYGSTALEWDRWPEGWLDACSEASRSLWCFGTLRLFMKRAAEFSAARWKLSHDIVWEKENGTGFAADRLKGVHETLGHFYQGDWAAVHHVPPKVKVAWRTAANGGREQPPHTGAIGNRAWDDDGSRIARSVQRIPNMWRRRPIHPTQKPSALLSLLAEYACPKGGLIIDPFAGSGSTLITARMIGRRAVGVEADEKCCERAARWLSQLALEVS